MAWISTELDDEEKLDMMMPLPMERPDYPCGLRLSFDKAMLKKLHLDELPKVGDLLDLRAMMEVTHVSDGPMGQCIETQITLIKDPIENEDTEEAAEPKPKRRKLFYG